MKRNINPFTDFVFKFAGWLAFMVLAFFGCAVVVKLSDNFESVSGFLLGLVLMAVCMPAGYIIIALAVKRFNAIGKQGKLWDKESEFVFAGKKYANFGELMYNYFNREDSEADVGKEFKYGVEFSDKYGRNLYVYVDSPPCFDAADFLYTPKFYYIFCIKGRKLCGLYTDSDSHNCVIDNNVRYLPECEYTSTDLLRILKHDWLQNKY